MAARQCQALVTEVLGIGLPTIVKKAIPNPTDALDRNAFGEGAVLGCDFVGTVEETGDQARKLNKGDLVAGLIWGGEIKGLGGYSEYTLADNNISFRLPKNITLEEAATLPLALMTAWLALFSKDCLAMPRVSGEKASVLIWGGSSSVGLYAIQITALHGFEVVITCSARHFDLVKRLGATHAFDYHDDDVIDLIKKAVPGIKYVFDTIGNETSSGLASRAIDENGGGLCIVRPGKANIDGVIKQTKVSDVFVFTAFLKEHRYGKFHWPVYEADYNLGTEFFEKLSGWVEEGKIRPSEPNVIPGGLDGVMKGF
ncbi:Zinc-type alcohol dehydrogenase-like protein [Colletotrichum viniferum]|nr:Zinc-type alcohol dehydrogenase-like protein [Colletotrichum viniferum]